jgi:hypothetical protein
MVGGQVAVNSWLALARVVAGGGPTDEVNPPGDNIFRNTTAETPVTASTLKSNMS